MKGFVDDIDRLTRDNRDFRRVLYTAGNLQLVLMSLEPGEEIGAEVHPVDQFFRIECGTGEVIMDGVRKPVRDGMAVLVPAYAEHDIINVGRDPLKLYTLYAPPNHVDGTVHRTRADAEMDDESFDGKTTENVHDHRMNLKKDVKMNPGQGTPWKRLGFRSLFDIGRLVWTDGINDDVAESEAFGRFVQRSLQSHASGDWGDVTREDKIVNEDALKHGGRLFSSYFLPIHMKPDFRDGKIWIITEADRSATTVLWPEEY